LKGVPRQLGPLLGLAAWCAADHIASRLPRAEAAEKGLVRAGWCAADHIPPVHRGRIAGGLPRAEAAEKGLVPLAGGVN
jgi:hypothetical protein